MNYSFHPVISKSHPFIASLAAKHGGLQNIPDTEKVPEIKSFPGIDLTRVLILEEGRQPASLFKSLGLVFGGVVLAGLGSDWFFLGAQQEE